MSGRDPMRDYYQWQRSVRRRQRLWTMLTIILFTVAAWAAFIIVLAMIALVFVTFS
jgi:type VI protein secretion system component VasF